MIQALNRMVKRFAAAIKARMGYELLYVPYLLGVVGSTCKLHVPNLLGLRQFKHLEKVPSLVIWCLDVRCKIVNSC